MNPNIHWPDETLPVQICCAPGVLTRLEMMAADGLLAIPRTGLGVGGLLLGRRQNGGIEILEAAEISCSHALGPAFALTAKEIAASTELAVNGSEVVGWYCSKPVGSKAHSPVPTEHDHALFDALCPEPWQLMLLVRPSMGKPTTAVFGLRASADSGRPFLIGTPRELAWQELAAFQVPGALPDAEPTPPDPPQVEAASTVIPVPMPQTGTPFRAPVVPPKAEKARGLPLRLFIIIMAAILLALLSMAAFFTRSYWITLRRFL